jgi:hypothetical protein
MANRYPKKLSSGANNVVIALNEREVAKLFVDDTRSDIGSEAEKLKFANTINGLLPTFFRLEFDAELQAEMLVMERLYPLDYRAWEYERRELVLSVFEDELSALHKGGFVHRDLCRPSNVQGDRFDNIFLTEGGIRLIDVGVSALKSQVGQTMFSRFVEQEKEEFLKFSEFFLNR